MSDTDLSSRVDVEHMLESLEIENVTNEGDEIRFSCPFPGHLNGDRNASAYMNVETGAFFCHGCKERGDATTFTSRVLEISPLEAIRLLKQAYQPGGLNVDARAMVDEVQAILSSNTEAIEPQPQLPEDSFAEFDIDWRQAAKAWRDGMGHAATDYILGRGFTPETLTEWGFGYDEKSDRVVFTVRDLAGNIVGYKGRAWQKGHEPKYLVLGDRNGRDRYGWPCYFTGRVIFGLDRAIQIEDPGSEDMPRHFIVCEGELNAVACWQAGYAAVAINGSNFTDAQAALLRQEADLVTLFFDTDEAGDRCAWGWDDAEGKHHPGVVEKLKPYIPIKIVEPHEGDPGDMHEDQISELISGAKSATLAQLSVLRSQ